MLKRVFILLASGTLCIYRADRDTAILEKLQYPHMLKDSEGKSLTAQHITSMSFASTRPPRYDCEIFTEAQNLKKKHGEEDPEEILVDGRFESESYLVFVSILSFLTNIGSL